MTYLLRTLSVEHLKLKRTLTAWMVFVAPFVVNLMYFFTMLDQAGKNPEYSAMDWVTYMTYVLEMWSVLMLPLLITLESALLSYNEHTNQQWKHLFALPLPRWSHFAAKWVLLFELILCSSLINFVLAITFALASGNVFPFLGLTIDSIPWALLLLMNINVFLAAMFILSIHIWISLHWQNIVVSIGSGMVAVVASIFIMRSKVWAPVFPWTLPISSFKMVDAPIPQIFTISLIGGLLFALFGAWEFSRRESM